MRTDGSEGYGSLKARNRGVVGAPVIEFLFEYWWHDGEGAKAKPVRITLGRFGDGAGRLTLSEARDKARSLAAAVREGRDPKAEQDAQKQRQRVEAAALRVELATASERTLAGLLSAYVAHLRAGKRQSARDVETLFARRMPSDLLALPAAAITPEHIAGVLAALVGPDVESKKGREAVKLRACLSSAFKLAQGASIDPMAPASAAGYGLTMNPAAAVPVARMAAAFNRAGERTLSIDEMRAYLAHVAALPATVQRLALLFQVASAGQRIEQLLRISDSDVVGDTLVMWDSKGRRQVPRRHVLPLVPALAELISSAREARAVTSPVMIEGPQQGGGDLIEPRSASIWATESGPLHPSTLSAAVYDICTAMLADPKAKCSSPFRGGDIRRTVETMLAQELRVPKDSRAQLLSHGISGVQDRHYDKGDHLEEKRRVLNAWNDWLADLCIGPQHIALASNVRRLHAA